MILTYDELMHIIMENVKEEGCWRRGFILF